MNLLLDTHTVLWFFWDDPLLKRILIHELKKVRQASGLTLAAVSKCTGMDQATLSRLENGRQANPTVDTLWRYAGAIGRRLVLTHAEAGAQKLGNAKAARAARG